MKILLASKEKFLLDKGYELLDIPRSELRIGAIVTHLKPVVDQDYLKYVEEYRQGMKESGILFEEFDIEGKNHEEIIEFFKDKNVVQIAGGNVFYLIKFVKETGFDKILKELLGNGLSYVGTSAGSYIMTPNLQTATWRGKDNFGVTDLTALDYVPFVLKVHYNDTQAEYVKKNMEGLKFPLRILRDDQAILIEDGKETFIGGPEVILK